MRSQAEPGNEKCGTILSLFQVLRQFLTLVTIFGTPLQGSEYLLPRVSEWLRLGKSLP